jgi:hypothetical protein
MLKYLLSLAFAMAKAKRKRARHGSARLWQAIREIGLVKIKKKLNYLLRFIFE